MERPVPKILREEVANPLPAGFIERVGITALTLPHKKIGLTTTLVVLCAVGVVSAGSAISALEGMKQLRSTPNVSSDAEGVYGTYPLPLVTNHLLGPNRVPYLFYDGGIIVNQVDGLDIVTNPGKIEYVIRRLSWYNNPERTRPVITVFAPVSEAQLENYSFGNTPSLLSRYEKEKKVTISIAPSKNIAMWDVLRNYIDYFDHPAYMEKLSYNLSREFFQNRLKSLNRLSHTDVPRDLSNADLEMIQRELPLRVYNIDPKVRDFILKG